MNSSDDQLQGVILARMLEDYYPPTIRRDIFNNEDLFEKFDQSVDAKLSVGKTGITVSRSALYKAARQSFSEGKSVQVNYSDDNIEAQKLLFELRDDDIGAYNLVSGEKRVRLFDLWMLTDNVEAKLAEFERLAKKYNLSNSDFDRLAPLVEAQEISDREVDLLLKAFENTPARTIERILEDIQHGNSEIDSLIPPRSDYFVQLIGKYVEGHSFEEYVSDYWKRHLTDNLHPETSVGLRMALRCSAHQFVSYTISETIFDSNVAEQVLASIGKSDLISKIGAVEYMVPYLADHPKLRKPLINIINQLREDDPEDKSGLYNSFSKIFVFVDGEISRLKLFENCAPFYRRFASMTQASLIQDCILNAKIKIPHFTKWAWERGSQNFYFQNLFDLRFEPYWVPEYVNSAQWKSEIIGRLLNVANNNHEFIGGDPELKKLLLDFESEELKKYATYPGPFIPGPMEGHSSMPPELSKELKGDVELALDGETIDYKSFVLLVNFSRFFKLSHDHAGKAIKALSSAHENILIEEESKFYDLILGFASVAGVAKTPELAEQIRVLIRKFSNLDSSRLNPTEIFRIAVIAAASHESLEDWCKYIGDFTFELASWDLNEDQVNQLYSSLRCLLDISPELWATCGNSERALFSLLQ
jgi:hypothetical protein